MSRPFLVVQLSDPHIGGTWAHADSAAAWQATIEAVGRLPDPPDAVLVSGDLADNAADAEYAAVKAALEAVPAPAYVLPGNHDDRDRLREHFGLPGESGEPVCYAADLGPLRLLVLDTTRPGHNDGELGREQLDWLDAELSAAPHRVSLLAMHHPPFATGIPAWDALGLARSCRAGLGDVVARHPQVLRILAGHVHRAFVAELAGRVTFSGPSTYVQLRFRVGATELELSDEPPAFAVHAVRGREVLSFIQPVAFEPTLARPAT